MAEERNRSERYYSNPEHVLQVECVEWFRKMYPYYIIFSTNNEATRMNPNYFEECGMYRGLSDLVVVAPQGVLFVELKIGFNEMKDYQLKCQEKLEAMGYVYRAVYCLDTFKDCVMTFLAGKDVMAVPEYYKLRIKKKKKVEKHGIVPVSDERGFKRNKRLNDIK